MEKPKNLESITEQLDSQTLNKLESIGGIISKLITIDNENFIVSHSASNKQDEMRFGIDRDEGNREEI